MPVWNLRAANQIAPRSAGFVDAPVAQGKRSRFVIDRLGVRIPSGAPIVLGTPEQGRCAKTAGCANMERPLLYGGVGEWLKPPDCKSGVRKGFAGSNPAPSTIKKDPKLWAANERLGNRAHETECKSKSSPDSSAVEHVLGKNGVGGSIPPLGSRI